MEGAYPLTLPALISPFCSACRGPGQQGREAQAEGDHLRLWGERVRGELSTREPAPEVPHWQRAGLRVLALPRGQRGAAPLQAQPAPPLVVLGCGLGLRASLPTVDSWAWPFQAFASRASPGPTCVTPGHCLLVNKS